MPGCPSFCLLTVPCSCIVITNELVFQSPLTQSENQTGNIDKVYPVNLALLQHFFSDTQLENVLANTTYKQCMSVVTPKFKIYKHKTSGILAQDQKFNSNLKTIAERVKNSSTIYNSITDVYLDEQFSFDDGDTFDFNLVLSIMGVPLAVINFLIIIYVLRKFQLLSTILVMAHGVRTVGWPWIPFSTITPITRKHSNRDRLANIQRISMGSCDFLSFAQSLW